MLSCMVTTLFTWANVGWGNSKVVATPGIEQVWLCNGVSVHTFVCVCVEAVAS